VQYPQIHSFDTGVTKYSSGHGSEYYGPSISDPSEQPTSWRTDPPKNFYDDDRSGTSIFLAGAAAATALISGFIPVTVDGKPKRLGDFYLQGLHSVEEYSPGRILSTFQAANFFSQFESTVVSGSHHISGELLGSNHGYREYLSKLIGDSVKTEVSLVEHGVTLRDGKLFWGHGDKVALQYAGAIRSVLSSPETETEAGMYASSWIGAAWSRVVGSETPSPERFFTLEHPYAMHTKMKNVANPMIDGLPIQIVGGQSRAEITTRWGQAWNTEFVGRFNRLLKDPGGFLPESITKYLRHLGVKDSTGGRMLFNMTKKFGFVLPAAYMGYKMLDWGVRQSTIFNGTMLEEGTTVAAATMWAKGNLALSSMSEAVGGHTYRDTQEDIAPGSTSLIKLSAFPIMGAIGAGGLAYLTKSRMMIQEQINSGRTSAEARMIAEKKLAQYGEDTLLSNVGKYLTHGSGLYSKQTFMGNIWRKIAKPISDKTPELTFKIFGRMGPVKLAAFAGSIAGAALVTPFIPGALLPEYTRDELEDIYSGKQEVEVRKGRWWEFGKCLISDTSCALYNNTTKEARDIEIGDWLVGINHEAAVVKHIFVRQFTGKIKKFYTAYDPELPTGLTGNHIVPVLRHGKIEEIPAEEIVLGDYVCIPAKLDFSLDTVGSIIIDDSVYSEIIKIEESNYSGLVYDFEVDHEKHFFQAGAFLVHNSAYEGDKVSYYRPHWYARLRNRSKEKSIWGNNEDEITPLGKLYRQEFTYELEEKHYRDRPYPISSLPFADVPLLGPILSNTLGRLIKPPKLMHESEWMGKDGPIAEPSKYGERIATEIGETAGPAPVSPYSIKSTISDQVYRLTELSGLPGFIATSTKQALTGTPDLFDQTTQLESARRMFGAERDYWDRELGGMLGTSEVTRRLYPHRQHQVPLYNPIRNTMPNWLPGPGSRSVDFRHGDPYSLIPEGELRLPGDGYTARFSELEGLSPEAYPLIHQFKILSDVAPFSKKYKESLYKIRAARKKPDWTDHNEELYQESLAHIEQRKKKKEFNKYKYLSAAGDFSSNTYYTGEDSSGLLAEINKAKANQQEEHGMFSKIFGGYWEALSHNAETTFDQMTPVSPGAKLVHQRTAEEDYERTQLYGTHNAFWQNPIKDFLRPSSYLAAKSFGYEGVPSHIESKRKINEYFDILKYVKNTRLASMARSENDKYATKIFEKRKDQTLFGINPFTSHFSSIANALPVEERDYLEVFSSAETEQERHRILEMIPKNEQAIYLARWKLNFADEIVRAQKTNTLSKSQIQAADNYLKNISSEKWAEGLPVTDDLLDEYNGSKKAGENYADWYRRVKLLPHLPNLPGPDWVGFHPSVDLDDVKLKLVQTLGEDIHDYGLWESRAQKLMNKPYINDEAIQELLEAPNLSNRVMRDKVNELLLANNIDGTIFSHSIFGDDETSITINHHDTSMPNLGDLF